MLGRGEVLGLAVLAAGTVLFLLGALFYRGILEARERAFWAELDELEAQDLDVGQLREPSGADLSRAAGPPGPRPRNIPVPRGDHPGDGDAEALFTYQYCAVWDDRAARLRDIAELVEIIWERIR